MNLVAWPACEWSGSERHDWNLLEKIPNRHTRQNSTTKAKKK
jgi:hypothetical protein